VFRDVAIEALRGGETLVAPVDLGLPDVADQVSGDAATCLDPSAGTTER
jgi:hypothetical protein